MTLEFNGVTVEQLVDRYRAGEREFEKLDLSNLDFYHTVFTGATFKDCNLRHVSWSDATLEDVTFISCILDDADFEYSRMRGVTIRWGSAMAAHFDHATLLGASFEGSSYTRYLGASFQGTLLSDATIIGCDFTGANFRNATLFGSKLSGSVFPRVDFAGAQFDARTTFEHTSHDLMAALLAQHLTLRFTPEHAAMGAYEPEWAALIGAREAVIGALTLHSNWCWMEYGDYLLRNHRAQVAWVQEVLGQYPDLIDRVHLGNQGILRSMHWHEREQLALEEKEKVRIAVQREREQAMLGVAPAPLTTSEDVLEFHIPLTGCTCRTCREARLFKARREAEQAARDAVNTPEAAAARVDAKRAARAAADEAERLLDRARDALDVTQEELSDARNDEENAQASVEQYEEDLRIARDRLSSAQDEVERLEREERERIEAVDAAQTALARARLLVQTLGAQREEMTSEPPSLVDQHGNEYPDLTPATA